MDSQRNRSALLRRGFDEEGEVRQKDGAVGEFFSITRKLAGEDTEQLVEIRFGDNKLILLLDNAPRANTWSAHAIGDEEDCPTVLQSNCTGHGAVCQRV
jgi:hypothetical protein